MNTLFDIVPVLPEGFTYQDNFINVGEETQLVKMIEQFELKNMLLKIRRQYAQAKKSIYEN